MNWFYALLTVFTLINKKVPLKKVQRQGNFQFSIVSFILMSYLYILHFYIVTFGNNLGFVSNDIHIFSLVLRCFFLRLITQKSCVLLMVPWHIISTKGKKVFSSFCFALCWALNAVWHKIQSLSPHCSLFFIVPSKKMSHCYLVFSINVLKLNFKIHPPLKA